MSEEKKFEDIMNNIKSGLNSITGKLSKTMENLKGFMDSLDKTQRDLIDITAEGEKKQLKFDAAEEENTNEDFYKKIIKIMEEHKLQKIIIEKKYLTEFTSANLCEVDNSIYQLPKLKPGVEYYLKRRFIQTKYEGGLIIFEKM